MQVNVQTSGFSECSLTVEGSSIGFFAVNLVQRSPAEHARCNATYFFLKDKGSRFLRCRSSTSALPTQFSVEFGNDPSDCL
jgi:hypothetical protein